MGKIYLNIICDNSCNNYSELFMSYNHGKCQYSDSKKTGIIDGGLLLFLKPGLIQFLLSASTFFEYR